MAIELNNHTLLRKVPWRTVNSLNAQSIASDLQISVGDEVQVPLLNFKPVIFPEQMPLPVMTSRKGGSRK